MSHKQNIDRRSILGLGVAGAGLWTLRPLQMLSAEEGKASGQENEADDQILIVVQLSGGNDGINTIIPYADPEYGRARRRLRIAETDMLKVDKQRAFHSSLKGMFEIMKSGKLAVVQGVGYPNPNRSHFKSMDIWHSADPTARDLRYGWLGRALDLLSREKSGIPELGVNFAARPPLAMNGVTYKPVSFQDVNSYRYDAPKDQVKAYEKLSTREQTSPGKGGGSVLDALRRTAEDARLSSRSVRAKARGYRTPVQYPRSPFANMLKLTAAQIAGGLSARVYYAYHNGFDTHVNQGNRHNQLFLSFDRAITAFVKDMQRLGVYKRVTIMCFSEFGRRVRENQSAGTDHGTAGPVFVIGGRVKGGFYGEQPSLTDLIGGGDLKHNVDFRSIYATLLNGCLGLDAKKVLKGSFATLPILG